MNVNRTEYKLLYLDTNVLREMVVTPAIAKNFFERFLSENYIPCFSIYNITELKNTPDIFEGFLQIWGKKICFLILPYKAVVYKEKFCYENNMAVELATDILVEFVPSREITLREYIEVIYNGETGGFIKENLENLSEVVKIWETQRKTVSKIKKGFSYKKSELIWTVGIADKLGIHNITMQQLEKMPGLRMVCYSQFKRTLNPGKTIKKNDAMDVMISSIYPYMDAIISENAQIEINRQAQNLIPEMKGKELYTLKDIRLFKKD